MRISSVRVYRKRFAPMKEGPSHTIWPVVVSTDTGIEGAGEIGLAYGTGGNGAAQTLLDFARSKVLGRDPFRTEQLQDDMRRGSFWGHVPGPVIGGAISAIDEALWDIKGKALGQPVHALLGGACREQIRVYCNGWYRDAGQLEDYTAAAAAAKAKGFTALKLDPMKLDLQGRSISLSRHLDRAQEDLAVARVEVVRAAIGPEIDLILELHGNMWPMDSIRFAKRIAHLHPLFMEEVADAEDASASREVGLQTGIAIAGGERLSTLGDFRRHFELRSLQVAQPDLGIAGGFTGVKAIAALASAHGIYVQPHNCGGPVSTAACVHLSFAIPNLLIQEIFPCWPEDDRLRLVDDPFEKRIEKGHIALPTGPGLGICYDREYLASCDLIGEAAA